MKKILTKKILIPTFLVLCTVGVGIGAWWAISDNVYTFGFDGHPLPLATHGEWFDAAITPAISGGGSNIEYTAIDFPDGLYIENGRIRGIITLDAGAHTLTVLARCLDTDNYATAGFILIVIRADQTLDANQISDITIDFCPKLSYTDSIVAVPQTSTDSILEFSTDRIHWGDSLTLSRNDSYIVYARIPQSPTHFASYPAIVTTLSTSLSDQGLLTVSDGIVIAITNFAKSYLTGSNLSIPSVYNGITITHISPHVLNVCPTILPVLILPNTLTHIDSPMQHQGIDLHPRRIVVLTSTAPPIIRHISSGGQFVVPEPAITSYFQAWDSSLHPRLNPHTRLNGGFLTRYVSGAYTLIAFVGTDTRITIPQGVTTIASYAFWGINNITAVYSAVPMQSITIGNNNSILDTADWIVI